MGPLGPYFKNRGISDSLAGGRKRVNEPVPFGVARGTRAGLSDAGSPEAGTKR